MFLGTLFTQKPSVPEIHASVTLGPFWADTGVVETAREIRACGLNSSFFMGELTNLKFIFSKSEISSEMTVFFISWIFSEQLSTRAFP